MVVADEIHDSLSPMYFNFFKYNSYTHLIGLSATIDGKTKYDINGEEVSKTDLLDRIAPVVFKYSINEGQIDETSRKICVIVIEHELDRRNKNIERQYVDKKTKEKKSFFVSEQEAYDFAHKAFLQQLYSRNRSEFLIRYWGNQRTKLLYQCKSKNVVIKELLQYINRTLIFGNHIDTLQEICPVVSSKNDRNENDMIIHDFNMGLINTIGSFKMLKQGITLQNLNHIIMHSYFKVQKDWIQRVGRLRKTNEMGYVFIFKTLGTQEEKAFKTMMEGLEGFPIITCNSHNLIYKFNQIKNGN